MVNPGLMPDPDTRPAARGAGGGVREGKDGSHLIDKKLGNGPMMDRVWVKTCENYIYLLWFITIKNTSDNLKEKSFKTCYLKRKILIRRCVPSLKELKFNRKYIIIHLP